MSSPFLGDCCRSVEPRSKRERAFAFARAAISHSALGFGDVAHPMWTSGGHSRAPHNGRDASGKGALRMGMAVGVDLGTTNSVIACHGSGQGARGPQGPA